MIEKFTKKKKIPNVEINDYNVVIDGRNFFDQPIKNYFKTYNNIRKTGQADDYTTGCLQDYTYSGISIKRTSLVQNKKCPLCRDVCFIDNFLKII